MVELAVLFAELVSVTTGSLSVAVAELVMAEEPAATVTFTVALVPASIPPRVQLKLVPIDEQAPWVVENDTSGAGRVSASITFAALPGPLLLMVMVKVTNEPAFTDEGELIERAMSVMFGATGLTVLEGSEGVELPAELVATTTKLYVEPLVSPVKFTPVWLAGTVTLATAAHAGLHS